MHVCSVAQLCPSLCNPVDYKLTRFLCPWDSPGKNTGVGCHFLLQRIFPTQELKLRLSRLLHWQVDSLPPHTWEAPPGLRHNLHADYSQITVCSPFLSCGLQTPKAKCLWAKWMPTWRHPHIQILAPGVSPPSSSPIPFLQLLHENKLGFVLDSSLFLLPYRWTDNKACQFHFQNTSRIFTACTAFALA